MLIEYATLRANRARHCSIDDKDGDGDYVDAHVNDAADAADNDDDGVIGTLGSLWEEDEAGWHKQGSHLDDYRNTRATQKEIDKDAQFKYTCPGTHKQSQMNGVEHMWCASEARASSLMITQ